MQKVNIKEVKSNTANPRIIKDGKFKQLVQSIKEFPEMLELRPIVVNADMVVLGGNMRLKACFDAGLKEVPIIIADSLDETKQKEFIIKDNVGFGEWDWNVLANEWEVEELAEWGLDLPLDFEDETEIEAVEDDYEQPDTIETDIVLGDLFEIGEHRLLCGDSTDSDAVAKLMDGNKIGLIVTDPPYGIGIDGQKESKAKNPKHNRKHHENLGWDSERPSSELFGYLLAQNVPTLIWGGNYFADLLPASRGWLYWSKGQSGLTMSDGELAWTSKDKVLREFTVNRAELKGSVHPTQKPVKVINESIKYLDSKGIIFDCFLGSGTTMVAANEMNRVCYGIEMEPKYCQVIIDRMRKLDPTLVIKRNGHPYESISQHT
jgi:DNA modification methylase